MSEQEARAGGRASAIAGLSSAARRSSGGWSSGRDALDFGARLCFLGAGMRGTGPNKGTGEGRAAGFEQATTGGQGAPVINTLPSPFKAGFDMEGGVVACPDLYRRRS